MFRFWPGTNGRQDGAESCERAFVEVDIDDGCNPGKFRDEDEIAGSTGVPTKVDGLNPTVGELIQALIFRVSRG